MFTLRIRQLLAHPDMHAVCAVLQNLTMVGAQRACVPACSRGEGLSMYIHVCCFAAPQALLAKRDHAYGMATNDNSTSPTPT